MPLRDVQKIFFENFDFSPFLSDFSPKKGSQPPNEIENMPLRSDKIICFVIRRHFELENYKNMKFFSYAKIFQKIQTAVSRLLLMPGCSAAAQIKVLR